MVLTPLMKYLLIVNGVGFVLYIINMLLYTYTQNGQIDALLTVASFIGGSLGIVIAIVLFDRKAAKENMMSRVFVFCMLVIQIIAFLVVRGHLTETLHWNIWEFLKQQKWLEIYLAVINVVTFIAFAIDKVAAIYKKSRIRIVTLLLLCAVGGSIGGIVGMYLLRHKIRKDYFTVGVPLIIIMQLVILLYAMNAAW